MSVEPIKHPFVTDRIPNIPATDSLVTMCYLLQATAAAGGGNYSNEQ
jgi:hypothetical protein